MTTTIHIHRAGRLGLTHLIFIFFITLESHVSEHIYLKKKGVQLVCVHVVVWEGGGVEVEVLCSTCTQVTKRDFTSSVAHRRTFYESICFAELRNKVKK